MEKFEDKFQAIQVEKVINHILKGYHTLLFLDEFRYIEEVKLPISDNFIIIPVIKKDDVRWRE